MRIHVQLSLLLCGGLAACGGLHAAEPVNPRYTGMPFARVWQAEDYGASNTSRGVVQQPGTGYMYFANAGGLLEFDGQRWRLHLAGNGIGTLLADTHGHIWYGADKQLGYLAPDAHGELRPHSVLSQLPPGEPSIFPLGGGTATPDGVYFTARNRIIRFSSEPGGHAQIWHVAGDQLAAPTWLIGGVVHVRGSNGVYAVREDGLHMVDGLRTVAFATRRDPAGGWQLINRDGVRRWNDAYVSVGPGLPVIVAPLQGDTALCGTFLRDGRIAFGTTRSGIIVCDPLGQRLQTLNHAKGLLSDRVEALYVDRDGGLWATFRNGIMRLQVDSPYARHGTGQQRIEGTPTAIVPHDSQLYVGGGEGLWRRDPGGDFHPVADVPQYVRSLAFIAGELYITGIELRRVLRDDRTALINTTYFGLVSVTTSPGFVIHGNNDGLACDAVSRGDWSPAGQLQGITGATTALFEYPAGVVWAANQNTGLWRVDLRGGISAKPPVKNYRAAQGIPAALNQYNADLFSWDGGLAAVLAGRFMRYDEAADRFVPETRVAGLPLDANGIANVWLLGSRPGSDGSLWVQPRTTDAPLVRIAPDAPHHWHMETPPGPPLTHFQATAIRADESTRSVWLASPGVLVSRDLTWRLTAPARAPEARVRRIELPDGKLIWAEGATAAMTALPAEQNRLRVVFTAATFDGDVSGRAHLQFRTRLAGLGEPWGAWTADSHRDFTNLPYREFIFQVQARDDYGVTGQPTSFAFTVAPPWWLTRSMYVVYALLGLGALAGIVRRRTSTLRRRAAALEAVVAARTEELRQNNLELARLHAIERDEKLAARLDEEKARLEMLRYQLNPHFLYNTLTSICGTARTNPDATRTMAQRLADFCRQTLTRGDETETVREEVRLLQSYLDIEKTRWRDTMKIDIDVAEDVLDERLPTFLLLPLLENAIKHGGRTTQGVLQIRLRIRRDADTLEIEVANTGIWDTVTPNPHSTGIGLENLRRRLARYCANRHTFTIGPESDWVIARLRITNVPAPTSIATAV